MSITPSKLASLLAAMIPARLPLLITGSPGIGKSDIIAQSSATERSHSRLSRCPCPLRQFATR